MTAPKWRQVSVHGQPQPEDYPIVWRWGPDDDLPCLTSKHHGDLADNVTQWAPVELPEGDEPPPLPAPFRPMSTVPSEIGLVFVLLGDGRVVTHSYPPVPATWTARGWCRPYEWPYAPVTP